MHWSEEIAQRIIDRNPNKEEYVCAAGISPSGSIHIGNFRDIATSYFVMKALQKKGKKAKLLFSWDEYDRLRKVPVNVSVVRPDLESSIGKPYTDVEDPFGCCGSYAKHFENEFEKSIKRFGIDMDYRYQTEMYRSGVYKDHIITALKKRKEIFDILDSFRTQDAEEGQRDRYYPATIYCPTCAKDTTTIHALSEDCTVAEYTCACGHKGSFDFTKDYDCKLAWKVDWPMRWMYEGVDFEPAGKDHASPTGSFQTSRIIAEKIYGFQAPMFQGYEFIGIKGSTGKMSGSTGLNLTPATLLDIYQPEVILWLYSKTDPTKAFDFCFDDGILRQYFEFDKMLTEYRNSKEDPYIEGIMYNTVIKGRENIETVPMALLVSLGSVVDFNVPMLEIVFDKIGTPYKEANFGERLGLAKYWLEQCAPENVNRIRTTRNFEVYNTLTEEEKKEIVLLHEYLLSDGYSLDELNQYLYAIPKKVFGEDIEDKVRKKYQSEFFSKVYQLLIDKSAGPRLYLFLFAIEKQSYVKLLDFSAPQTDEEKQAEEQNKAKAEAEEQKAKEDEAKEINTKVADIKPQVEIDDFGKLDLRVCKVTACEEVKKSRSCLKLTLFDGIRTRIIVSSIKEYYKPEELVGKKIIVIANLKPAKLVGIQSEGMLLAGSNDACGCKVVFVDDALPEGTRIS